MQNCYAVVSKNKLNEDVVVAVHTTPDAALAYVDMVGKHFPACFGGPATTVVEVALTAAYKQSEDPLARIEQELQTLKTLLTALNGRVDSRYA